MTQDSTKQTLEHKQRIYGMTSPRKTTLAFLKQIARVYTPSPSMVGMPMILN